MLLDDDAIALHTMSMTTCLSHDWSLSMYGWRGFLLAAGGLGALLTLAARALVFPALPVGLAGFFAGSRVAGAAALSDLAIAASFGMQGWVVQPYRGLLAAGLLACWARCEQGESAFALPGQHLLDTGHTHAGICVALALVVIQYLGAGVV